MAAEITNDRALGGNLRRCMSGTGRCRRWFTLTAGLAADAATELVPEPPKLLPAEAFLLIAENSLAMAARYQPELANRETGEKQPNPNYNEERYAFFR